MELLTVDLWFIDGIERTRNNARRQRTVLFLGLTTTTGVAGIRLRAATSFQRSRGQPPGMLATG